jgi:hypothetical protein
MNHTELNIGLLRAELEKKAKNEWEEKWSDFGIYDSSKQNRRSKFYTSFAEDISQKSSYHISRDTINRFDKNLGGDSISSLDAYSRYLGFDSFEDFSNKFSIQKTPKSSNKYKKAALVMFTFLVSIIILFFTFISPTLEKKAIKNLIIKANEVQFEAYKSLDTLNIITYYHPEGSAYKAIVTLIKINQQNSRRICFPSENPSFQKVFTCEVESLKGNKAIVKTTEHWFLKWFDTDLKKYVVSYDEKNDQLYELIKEDNTWRIMHNYFEGKASSIDF